MWVADRRVVSAPCEEWEQFVEASMVARERYVLYNVGCLTPLAVPLLATVIAVEL